MPAAPNRGGERKEARTKRRFKANSLTIGGGAQQPSDVFDTERPARFERAARCQHLTLAPQSSIRRTVSGVEDQCREMQGNGV